MSPDMEEVAGEGVTNPLLFGQSKGREMWVVRLLVYTTDIHGFIIPFFYWIILSPRKLQNSSETTVY